MFMQLYTNRMHTRVPWTGRDVTKTQLANESTSMNIIEGEVVNLPERVGVRERERDRVMGSKESQRQRKKEGSIIYQPW